jgi:hypothetical protein
MCNKAFKVGISNFTFLDQATSRIAVTSEAYFLPSEKKTRQEILKNITLRAVCLTIVAVQEQKILHILCVCLHSCLTYPSCIVHAPYYIVVCRLSESTHFPTLSHKRYNSSKKVFEQKFGLRHFCKTFV